MTDRNADQTETSGREKGDEQHVLLTLVTYSGDVTEYRCQKCGKTGLGGIRGSCEVQTATDHEEDSS